MGQSEDVPLDEYERTAADARRVLTKMKTSLKLSEPFRTGCNNQQASSVHSGRISLTFTWTPPDHQK